MAHLTLLLTLATLAAVACGQFGNFGINNNNNNNMNQPNFEENSRNLAPSPSPANEFRSDMNTHSNPITNYRNNEERRSWAPNNNYNSDHNLNTNSNTNNDMTYNRNSNRDPMYPMNNGPSFVPPNQNQDTFNNYVKPVPKPWMDPQTTYTPNFNVNQNGFQDAFYAQRNDTQNTTYRNAPEKVNKNMFEFDGTPMETTLSPNLTFIRNTTIPPANTTKVQAVNVEEWSRASQVLCKRGNLTETLDNTTIDSLSLLNTTDTDSTRRDPRTGFRCSYIDVLRTFFSL